MVKEAAIGIGMNVFVERILESYLCQVGLPPSGDTDRARRSGRSSPVRDETSGAQARRSLGFRRPEEGRIKP